jgi:hypothetical protein
MRLLKLPTANPTQFSDSSSAAKLHIANEPEGATYFCDLSTAGSAHILNNYGGTTYFLDRANAKNADMHSAENVGSSNAVFLR